MLKSFEGLTSYFSSCGVKTVSPIFRLQTIFTAGILLYLCIVVTTKDIIGKPIHCKTDSEKVSEDFFNTHCWQSNTFTFPNLRNDLAESGVGSRSDDSKPKYTNYYQWVSCALFLQAILFYLPYWIWCNCWENRVIEDLTAGLRQALTKSDDRIAKVRDLAEYLESHKLQNFFYFLRYLLCEVLCIFILMGQMFLMHVFLNGEFITYGWRVIQQLQVPTEQGRDTMDLVFPKMTKCTFEDVGPSGTPRIHDAICTLPQNSANEKIYVFLWMWFAVLACLSVMLLLYRSLLIVPYVRRRALFCTSGLWINPRDWEKLCNRLTIGNWWMLYQLGSNLESLAFRDLVAELCNVKAGNLSSVTVFK